jgi:hypothetical protein
VFENRVLREIFVPKRDEVTGEWRKLRNVKIHDLYCLPSTVRLNKSRRIRWAGHVAHMGKNRGAYRVLAEEHEGKRPLGRTRCRWEDIKMDLQEVGCEGLGWIELAQDRNRWKSYVVLSCGRIYNLSVGAVVISARYIYIYIYIQDNITLL